MGLRRVADDFRHECGSEAADFIRNNFYVDDGLKSVPSPKDALNLIDKARTLCRRGGFQSSSYTRLPQTVRSQSTKFLQMNRASGVKYLDQNYDVPYKESSWCAVAYRI